jgi:hypothetical protein
MNEIKSRDERLDETVEDSFPASDPPSHTPATGTRKADTMPASASDHATAEDQPKGLPTSDRHAAETVAGRIEGTQPAERHRP